MRLQTLKIDQNMHANMEGFCRDGHKYYSIIWLCKPWVKCDMANTNVDSIEIGHNYTYIVILL